MTKLDHMVLTGRASFAQERLYFLNELQPGNPAYVVAFALRLDGVLQPDALAAALRRVVARHDALRTTFRVVDGVLQQRVHLDAEPEITVESAHCTDHDGQEAQLRELVVAEATRPFALGDATLVRAWIRSWSTNEHALVVLVHHIACDGWSVGLLLADLSAEYDAEVTGTTAVHGAEPVSSLRYAAKQRAEYGGDEAGLAFWRDTLADLPSLALPTDLPRPGVLSSRGAVIRRPVSPELLARLTGWAKNRGATLFTVALAAYALVLARYTGQDDVVVGVPVANRIDEDDEGLVGCLVNTVPVRVDLSGRPVFTELLDRVRSASMRALSWQTVPFEQIVQAAGAERALSHAPLFQTTLTVQNFPFALPGLTGLTVSEVDVEIDAAKFDLGLTLDVAAENPFLRAEYSTELFEQDTVTSLLAHCHTLLESIVDEKSDMVSPVERARLTTDAGKAMPRCPSVLERFAEHVRRDAGAVAIRHQGHDLSYGELDRWSDRIARALLAAQVNRGDRVSLLLHRSSAVAAAMLGVWKAGCAYVSLDPEYPRGRLDLIAAGAATRVTLAEPDTMVLAGELATARDAVLLDVLVADSDPAEPVPPPTAGELAYVIYTSGSTGTPKGVMVGHGGVDALCTPTPAGLDVTAADVWLCAHSFAFDFSVWELWGALTTGARLVVADQADLVDPARLAALVHAQGVTVLSQTPGSLYRMLPSYAELAGSGAPLRYVVTGGEALTWSRVAAIAATAPGLRAEFVNMYGITEGTVHVTIARVPAADLGSVRPGDIGVPLPSARCYVLDENREPAGIGVPGELYIGGALVAHGYLGRPDLTAERFLLDPFGPGVVYRTGDVVRSMADGRMVYLRRNDNQVQVRGHRVECGEVEQAFLDRPGVRACAVVPENDRLTAFVVSDLADAERVLRANVRAVLPGYLVPSRIVAVPAIPLTAHGKVDAPALLARHRPAVRHARPPTRGSSLEERIRRIWLEVLPTPEVGLHDNFFDLGGHSFALVAAQERMAAAGLDLTVTDLLRYGTVAACAAHFGAAAPTLPDTYAAARRAGRAQLAGRRRSTGGVTHD
ncbi:amino acid adenylation domain-containing protein [Amycolatopsis sp. NPDC051045]|uniref:non-ribosomal peptide synthetase n=1 Tax=Amycolatopsis sp. NPDC051045 TaxID=3156922 RepID=UPI0034459989